MKLREKTVFDLTVKDALKIIVIVKVARFTYRVFDKTAMTIVEKYKLDDKLTEKVDEASRKFTDKVVDTVYPPPDEPSQ